MHEKNKKIEREDQEKQIKRLVVFAHPAKESFNREIAKVVMENSSSAFFMDLYDKKWKQDFLVFDDMKKDWPDDSIFQNTKEKIIWADEIIFVYPTWWTGPPAILKNFIDINFHAGFAFRYVEGKPKGLLTQKKARVFTTAGSARLTLFLVAPIMKIIFAKAFLNFCGIKVLNFTVFADMNKWKDTKGREEKLKMLRNLLEGK